MPQRFPAWPGPAGLPTSRPGNSRLFAESEVGRCRHPPRRQPGRRCRPTPRRWRGSGSRDLFEQDPGRADRLTLGAAGLSVDLSKNRLTNKTLDLLLALARDADLARWIDRLFAGEAINTSEGRAAMHMALRAGPSAVMTVEGADVMPAVRVELERVAALSEAVRAGSHAGFDGQAITDVVVIGIGGSYLGPALAVEALAGPVPSGPRIHFLANVDGGELDRLLAGLAAATTLFVVVSKSFGTAETKINTEDARAWFLAQGGRPEDIAGQFIAVSANPDAVAAFGLDPGRMLRNLGLGRRALLALVGGRVAGRARARLRPVPRAAGRGGRDGRAFPQRGAGRQPADAARPPRRLAWRLFRGRDPCRRRL